MAEDNKPDRITIAWPPVDKGDAEMAKVKEAEQNYLNTQEFNCQNCGQTYLYGNAKNLLRRAPNVYKYSPLCFCTESCGDKYLHRTGCTFPPVGAEIPLSKPEPCNLHITQEGAKKCMTMTGEELISAVEPKIDMDDDKVVMMWTEIVRRTFMYDTDKEEARQDMVDSFAFSAGVAVAALWKAHRGRELTLGETKEFSKVLFDIFVKIR